MHENDPITRLLVNADLSSLVTLNSDERISYLVRERIKFDHQVI